MTKATIDIANDYSPTPGGRYSNDGPGNGEDFREKLLKPALQEYEVVSVILDGARGYPSSFLDEAFAGLLRSGVLDGETFLNRIEIVASGHYQIYRDDILRYVKEEASR